MTNSKCSYSTHDLEVELSLIFRAYFSWSATATRGEGLLEEWKVFSFCSSVENYFLVIKYKRRSLLKKKEEKGQQIKVNWWWSDVIYTYVTFLHDEATLIFHSSWVRIAFPILKSLYGWIFFASPSLFSLANVSFLLLSHSEEDAKGKHH